MLEQEAKLALAIPEGQDAESTKPTEEWYDCEEGSENGSHYETSNHEEAFALQNQSDSESAPSSADEEPQGVLMADPQHLTKGQKRRLKAAAEEIRQSYPTAQPTPKQPAAQPNPSTRRAGPLRLLQAFAFTMAMSVACVAQGWQVLEPVIMPRWNLSEPNAKEIIHDYLQRADPDAILVQWPSNPWMPQTTYTQRKCARQQRQLAQRRLQRRTLFPAIKWLRAWCQSHNKLLLGVSPDTSDAWMEPDIVESFPPASVPIPVAKTPGQKSKLRLAAPGMMCKSVQAAMARGKSFAPSPLRAAKQCLTHKTATASTNRKQRPKSRPREAYPAWEGEDNGSADVETMQDRFDDKQVPDERFMNTCK